MDNFVTERKITSEMRDCMRMHGSYGFRNNCVEQVVTEVFNETGYDLCNISRIRLANVGVKRTFKEWDSYFLKMNVDPLKISEVELLPACVVPKYAASMALHLRTKLGRLAPNEANMLLAEREYLRVSRGMNVRDVDIVSHQQFVLNALFGEDLLDQIALTRTRLPAWMKWAFDVKSLNAAPLAC